MKFWSKNDILVKKWNFGQKMKFGQKIWSKNFGQKMKFWPKNEILVKKWNFGQKKTLKILVKNDFFYNFHKFHDFCILVPQPISLCTLPLNEGNCTGSTKTARPPGLDSDVGLLSTITEKRFYFDRKSLKCKEFNYGRCGGNSNNFKSDLSCMGTCIKVGVKNLLKLSKKVFKRNLKKKFQINFQKKFEENLQKTFKKNFQINLKKLSKKNWKKSFQKLWRKIWRKLSNKNFKKTFKKFAKIFSKKAFKKFQKNFKTNFDKTCKKKKKSKKIPFKKELKKNTCSEKVWPIICVNNFQPFLGDATDRNGQNWETSFTFNPSGLVGRPA